MDDRTAEAQLRVLERTHLECECRLSQLTSARLPTAQEIDEALILSSSLTALEAQIEMLKERVRSVRTETTNTSTA